MSRAYQGLELENEVKLRKMVLIFSEIRIINSINV